MRKTVESAGFVLVVMGISGAIDHLWVQPLLGGVVNAVNRYLIPRLDFLTGYELYANLTVAALGVAVIVAGSRLEER